MSGQPYTPQGKTYLIQADTTPPTGVQVLSAGTLQSVTYRIANPEANETIFYSMVATSAADAKTLCVLPTAGTPTYVTPLPPGGVEVVRGPAGAYFSGITRTAAAKLYVTPGDGI